MRMIMRDIIKEQTVSYVSDGMGGKERSVIEAEAPIMCRVSQSTKLGNINQYGKVDDMIITVITDVFLSEDAIYLYNGKSFTLSRSVQKGRLIYSTLVETK